MSHHTNWQCSGSFQSELFLQEKGCGAVVGQAPTKAKAAILLAIADEADRNVLHRQ